MKKKIIPLLLILIIAAGIVIKLSRKSNFYYAGTVEVTDVDISSRLSSVISGYLVKEGDPIALGRLLVQLDSSDLKLAAEIAQKDFDRASRLLKEGSMPQETFDRLKYKRDDAALRLEWSSLKSPISGKVLYVYHEQGEWVTPGTKLLTLASLKEVWAYLYLPQKMISKLSIGMKVKGYLPDMDMKEFEGTITHINEEAEFTPKNVQTREERTRLVFGVKVTFQNSEGILKPGMTIEVKLPG